MALRVLIVLATLWCVTLPMQSQEVEYKWRLKDILQRIPNSNTVDLNSCHCKPLSSICSSTVKFPDLQKNEGLCPQGLQLCCEILNKDIIQPVHNTIRDITKNRAGVALSPHLTLPTQVPVDVNIVDDNTVTKTLVNTVSKISVNTETEGMASTVQNSVPETTVNKASETIVTTLMQSMTSVINGSSRSITFGSKVTASIDNVTIKKLGKGFHAENQNRTLDNSELLPISNDNSLQNASYTVKIHDSSIYEPKLDVQSNVSILEEELNIVKRLSIPKSILKVSQNHTIDKANVTFILHELLDICSRRGVLSNSSVTRVSYCCNYKQVSYSDAEDLSEKMINNLTKDQFDLLMIDVVESVRASDELMMEDESYVEKNKTLNMTIVCLEDTVRNICIMLNFSCERLCHQSVHSGMMDDYLDTSFELVIKPEYRYYPIALIDTESVDTSFGSLGSFRYLVAAPEKGIAFTAFYWSYVGAFLYTFSYLTAFIVSDFSLPGLLIKLLVLQYFPSIIDFPLFQVGDLVLTYLFN